MIFVCTCGKEFEHRPPDGTWGGKPSCDECWKKAWDEGRIGIGTARTTPTVTRAKTEE